MLDITSLVRFSLFLSFSAFPMYLSKLWAEFLESHISIFAALSSSPETGVFAEIIITQTFDIAFIL